MKYVSLFSGIGGFESALNKLGFECVLSSEIDKFANKAYSILYGEETKGDVTKIDENSVPDHNLLVAGFPCQAFSVAGKRKGFEDTRGTMFFEVARILAAKRPKVVLLENVKGLLSHNKGETLQIILQTLSEIGYTIDYTILNSKHFGVPQNRERVFIIGVLGEKVESYKVDGNNVLARSKRKMNEIGIQTFNFPFPKQKGITKVLADVLEKEVDEKYYLSEEKTKKLTEQIQVRDSQSSEIQVVGLLDMKGYDSVRRVYSANGISPTLTTREPKIVEPKQFTTGQGISYCLDANYTKGTAPGDVGKGRRTHTIEVRPVLTPDRENKRQNGRRFKENGEPSFTINTIDRHGVAIGNYPNYRIRKLTPLECFRLQGFPDSYYHKLKDAKISDLQLYKMAGNAVTVNVIEEIGKVIVNEYFGEVEKLNKVI